ncbi:hypothetical protein ONE63_005075 [Megalurothrips usitatus]|uniref:C2H2-type domain-containing protein n=1 Tax=Megalurothrips usitatus TaxID=439358 RepID=A0AAV7X1Q3_9NEOP|nr:hypothetical protein ONE63_005075 [Megalurothrips usitatus]
MMTFAVDHTYSQPQTNYDILTIAEFKTEELVGDEGYGVVKMELDEGAIGTESDDKFNVTNGPSCRSKMLEQCQVSAFKTQTKASGDGDDEQCCANVMKALCNTAVLAMDVGPVNAEKSPSASVSPIKKPFQKPCRHVKRDPPKLYCELCKATVCSKNMARHRKSKKHVRRSRDMKKGKRGACLACQTDWSRLLSHLSMNLLSK